MIPRTSQYHPGHEIPERNWYYRIAKRFLFNDFGVYDGHDHRQTAAPYIVSGNASGSRHAAGPSGSAATGAQFVTLGSGSTTPKE
jgi:hypothetical protein